MTDKQPLALKLADALEEKDYPPRRAAAAELRRLHEVNAELVEVAKHALETLDSKHDFNSAEWRVMHYVVFQELQAAIAKAGEQQ